MINETELKNIDKLEENTLLECKQKLKKQVNIYFILTLVTLIIALVLAFNTKIGGIIGLVAFIVMGIIGSIKENKLNKVEKILNKKDESEE